MYILSCDSTESQSSPQEFTVAESSRAAIMYKNFFIDITNNLIKDSDFPIIQDHSTDEYKNLIQTIIECKNIRKAIYVFDPDSILLAKYDGVLEAQKALNISHDTIKNYCKTGKVYNNRFIFSYHNLDLID